MKIILTGSSGFIGQEVLMQTLAHPAITSIIALSRKPLSETFTSNPKLQVVILDNFESYTAPVLSLLSGAESCIWTIGAKSTNPSVTYKVSIDYTLAATIAFAKLSAIRSSKFRFIFVSGIVAIRDQNSTVFLYGAARKAAGLAELKLVEFSKGYDKFETYIARPAGVTAKKHNMILGVIMGLVPNIRVDHLAAALIDLAVNGNTKQTFENRDLVDLGRRLLVETNREAAPYR